MTYHTDDTIAAIATPAGGAARGVVRLSGQQAIDVVAACLDSDLDTVRRLRHATALAGRLRIDMPDQTPRPLPCELFVWPNSRSYTREPVVEIHTLGSPPVLRAVLTALCGAGARLAEPGEFTLRAFLAGRLNLTQAEAVLGVIDARGDADLRTALSQLAGGLARPLQELRDELLQLLAELEAGLDFVDEDIEFIARDELVQRLNAAASLLRDLDQQMTARHAATTTQQVVLVGPPNAGKSSLYNALVARYARSPRKAAHPALVSEARGTTRDYLSATLELGGVCCELIDTAGSEADPDGAILPTDATELAHRIDRTAQHLARQQRERATIRMWCLDLSQEGTEDPFDRISLQAESDVIALTKADLRPGARLPDARLPRHVSAVLTSSRTGQGLDELSRRLGPLLAQQADAGRGRVVAATADRSRESIRLATDALSRAAKLADDGGGDELIAVELHAALDGLGKVVGAVYTDDLLDRIFNTFCIGK